MLKDNYLVGYSAAYVSLGFSVRGLCFFCGLRAYPPTTDMETPGSPPFKEQYEAPKYAE